MDGPEIQKWTVQRKKTERSEVMNLDGLKGLKWTVQRMKPNDQDGKNWTVGRDQMSKYGKESLHKLGMKMGEGPLLFGPTGF